MRRVDDAEPRERAFMTNAAHELHTGLVTMRVSVDCTLERTTRASAPLARTVSTDMRAVQLVA